jgi:hypothetical protein
MKFDKIPVISLIYNCQHISYLIFLRLSILNFAEMFRGEQNFDQTFETGKNVMCVSLTVSQEIF